MAPTHSGSYEGHPVTIRTKENDLRTKVVASVTWMEGKSEVGAVFGLRHQFKSEVEILAFLAGEGVEVGAQTSEYPIINIS